MSLMNDGVSVISECVDISLEFLKSNSDLVQFTKLFFAFADAPVTCKYKIAEAVC